MKHTLVPFLILIFILSSCKKEIVSKQIPSENIVDIDTSTVIVQDTNTIAKDPFKLGKHKFAESPEVFRERFNAYMQKSGWDVSLNKGVMTVDEQYNICTMSLTDKVKIATKLDKNNAVIKVVLFGKHDWNTRSLLPIIRGMKGMVAAGPAYRYITNDDIEVLMYQLGTLSNEEIIPKGMWIENGVRYEVKVEQGSIIFGVSI